MKFHIKGIKAVNLEGIQLQIKKGVLDVPDDVLVSDAFARFYAETLLTKDAKIYEVGKDEPVDPAEGDDE